MSQEGHDIGPALKTAAFENGKGDLLVQNQKRLASRSAIRSGAPVLSPATRRVLSRAAAPSAYEPSNSRVAIGTRYV